MIYIYINIWYIFIIHIYIYTELTLYTYTYTYIYMYIYICIVRTYSTHDWVRMWPIPTYYSGSPTSKKDWCGIHNLLFSFQHLGSSKMPQKATLWIPGQRSSLKDMWLSFSLYSMAAFSQGMRLTQSPFDKKPRSSVRMPLLASVYVPRLTRFPIHFLTVGDPYPPMHTKTQCDQNGSIGSPIHNRYLSILSHSHRWVINHLLKPNIIITIQYTTWSILWIVFPWYSAHFAA